MEEREQQIEVNHDGIPILHLHPQTRNTILFKSLEELWESHKIVYIFGAFLLVAVVIVSIIYVLTTVVVPSQRYNFLEQKEAEEMRTYLGFRRF